MTLIRTENPKFTIKFATPDDAGLVVSYMKKLGEYQKMLDKITVTEPHMKQLLADHSGEAILGNYNGETIAFIYFYTNSSAFTGATGIYIDAFFVDESMRSKGFGKMMMDFMSDIAIDSGCARLEWGCLDWNKPSVKFYENLGATSVDSMKIYRLPVES